MFSNFFFRNIKIITNKEIFEIDLVKNIILIDDKIKTFKNSNSQIDLLKKNILIFKERIAMKDFSLNDYDSALLDLDICIKMHNAK
jgi:hypothetical protein